MESYTITYEEEQIEVVGHYEEAENGFDPDTQPCPASFEIYRIYYKNTNVYPILEANQLALIGELVINQIEEK